MKPLAAKEKSIKFMMSVQLIAAAVAVTSLVGCGKTDSTVSPDGPVTALSGHFAGTYTGTCVVETETRNYTNCSTQVLIKERDGGITIRTKFLLNPTTNRGHVNNSNSLIEGSSIDTLKVVGSKLLSSDGTVIGSVGDSGFAFNRAGTPFTFKRYAAAAYSYTGTFEDGSGRTVNVTANVKRQK